MSSFKQLSTAMALAMVAHASMPDAHGTELEPVASQRQGKPIRWDISDADGNVGAQQTVRAAKIDNDVMQPLGAVRHIKVNDQPVLWVNKQREVFVDERLFSDLRVLHIRKAFRGDAAGRAVVLGKCASRRGLSDRQIVELLVCGELVRCKIMDHATVTLEREFNESGSYRAALSGYSVYYTNERNIEDFRFGIRIDADGTIRLMPE